MSAKEENIIDLAKLDEMSSYDIGVMRDKKLAEMNHLTNLQGTISGEIYLQEQKLAELKEKKRKAGVERSNLRNLIEILKGKFFSVKDDGR